MSMALYWDSDCYFTHSFLKFRVKLTSPAKVLGPSAEQNDATLHPDGEHSENKRNLSIDVLLSKPILALQFNCLKMVVESPLMVSHGLLNPSEK